MIQTFPVDNAACKGKQQNITWTQSNIQDVPVVCLCLKIHLIFFTFVCAKCKSGYYTSHTFVCLQDYVLSFVLDQIKGADAGIVIIIYNVTLMEQKGRTQVHCNTYTVCSATQNRASLKFSCRRSSVHFYDILQTEQMKY